MAYGIGSIVAISEGYEAWCRQIGSKRQSLAAIHDGTIVRIANIFSGLVFVQAKDHPLICAMIPSRFIGTTEGIDENDSSK